jgi:hypothetical protein
MHGHGPGLAASTGPRPRCGKQDNGHPATAPAQSSIRHNYSRSSHPRLLPGLTKRCSQDLQVPSWTRYTKPATSSRLTPHLAIMGSITPPAGRQRRPTRGWPDHPQAAYLCLKQVRGRPQLSDRKRSCGYPGLAMAMGKTARAMNQARHWPPDPSSPKESRAPSTQLKSSKNQSPSCRMCKAGLDPIRSKDETHERMQRRPLRSSALGHAPGRGAARRASRRPHGSGRSAPDAWISSISEGAHKRTLQETYLSHPRPGLPLRGWRISISTMGHPGRASPSRQPQPLHCGSRASGTGRRLGARATAVLLICLT